MKKLNNPFEKKCIFRTGYFYIVIPEKGHLVEGRQGFKKVDRS